MKKLFFLVLAWNMYSIYKAYEKEKTYAQYVKILKDKKWKI